MQATDRRDRDPQASDGDAVAPATFEELEVGQLVSATYSGSILESYSVQEGAGSIVILANAGEEPLCNIPEGCDFDGDGAAKEGLGTAQYDPAA